MATPSTYVASYFNKDGESRIASTWAEHYRLVFAGWTQGDPAPALPGIRTRTPAKLSDLDALEASLPAATSLVIRQVQGATIAAGAIKSTAGAYLGEIRRISSGEDSGTALVWWVPEGFTAPTWCYSIDPSSPYGD